MDNKLMKAAWYERLGAASEVLVLGDYKVPEPAPGEVLVRIRTSGVNPHDVKKRQGARGEMAFPRIIPHNDGAGIIEDVGQGVAKARIGERVWIYSAQHDQAYGTAASYVCVPTTQAICLPENVSFEVGACLGIPACTAHHCVFGDGSVTGKTILVSGGSGRVASYAIQLAKWGGASVIATVGSQAKEKYAYEAGADQVLNYRMENFEEKVLTITNGHGVDRIIEVEFGANLDLNINLLKQHGVLVSYGSVVKPTPIFPFYAFMFKALTLRTLTVFLLTEAQRAQAVRDITQALTDGKLKHTIGAVYPLDQIVKAHESVEQGTVIGSVLINL